MVKQYFKTCDICGKKFVAYNRQTRECEQCANDDSLNKPVVEKKKVKTLKQSREHNLNRTLYNLHKYNEEHGTRLTYGQYKVLLHFGKLED